MCRVVENTGSISRGLVDGLIQLIESCAERYKYKVTIECVRVATKLLRTCDGQAHKAKAVFASWDDERKLKVVFEVRIYRRGFISSP